MTVIALLIWYVAIQSGAARNSYRPYRILVQVAEMVDAALTIIFIVWAASRLFALIGG